MEPISPPSTGDNKRFAQVALPVPLNTSFTYEIPDGLAGRVTVGSRVDVPFGKRVLSGIVVDLKSSTDLGRVRPIERLYETYLSDALMKVTAWMASYYGCSMGEAAQSALPPVIRKRKRRRTAPARTASPLESIEDGVIELNPYQQSALETIDRAIKRSDFKPILLYGVTGSGKTEVYLRAAQATLAAGGGCIVLVPEIGLLPQAIARYERAFGRDIAILHSRLTGAERFDIWKRIEGGEVRFVLGPRSAVFSPVRNLGLIVVDEEQDESYKQDEKPRYHARSVALMRGKYENLTVVMGSATPSAETIHNATTGRYTLLSLPERAEGTALPKIEFVDMRTADVRGAFFSSRLVDRLEANIHAGHQCILFLNKRGHARFVQCNSCGWVARCRNCDISLTYHRVASRLKCHYCGYQEASVTRCPECGTPKLYFSGVGTQRVELDLASFFPGLAVLRMDADTTTGKEGHRRVLERFGTGEYPVLIGTQMVTKGHHFPRVHMVGVLNAEESLNFPDFRSSERTFRQLLQVAGRAGRARDHGEVVVQTYSPEHRVFKHLAEHDYSGFMEEELEIRRKLNYPPFSRLVLASFVAANESTLDRVVAAWVVGVRRRLAGGAVEVLGPAPPLVARVKSRYRQQVLLKGRLSDAAKSDLLGLFGKVAESVRGGRSVELRWDVDPETFY